MCGILETMPPCQIPFLYPKVPVRLSLGAFLVWCLSLILTPLSRFLPYSASLGQSQDHSVH